MATRQKTVCFAFETYTADVADAVTTNLTQTTLYIPESSPVFKSVYVEVGFEDGITATGGTINEHRVGLRLGAGETVNLYRADTGEKLMTTTTDASGDYSFTVYNDVLEYYTDAYVDGSNYGRSKNGTPATDFDITLAAVGGSSEHSYIFIG